MRKITIGLLLFAAVLAVSNPSKQDHYELAKYEIGIDDPSIFASLFTRDFMNGHFKVKNYFFFSVSYVTFKGRTTDFAFGIGGHVYLYRRGVIRRTMFGIEKY